MAEVDVSDMILSSRHYHIFSLMYCTHTFEKVLQSNDSLIIPFYLRWKAMFGIAAIPSVLLGLGMAMCPESPRWLFQVFAWLHSVLLHNCILFPLCYLQSNQ